jgi:2-polyprenyl-3-methyl-5-hydroxy-6-metoxy-1,4-benzoquinol methylase
VLFADSAAPNRRACPLCGAASPYAFTARDRNRETTSERFTYNRCIACATIFMADAPADLSRYYLDDYHGFKPDGAPEWTTNPALLEVEAFRVRLLRRHVEPGSLIDVGAGPGGFAAAARDEGFEVTAIEMDERCCDYMESRIGVRAIRSDQPIERLKLLPGARVISMWHVLEHLRDPAGMLVTAAECLQPGGVLAVGVPNPDSMQFRLLGANWAHLDAPRHLSLIPAAAIATHLETLGLRQLEALTADPFGRICNLYGWSQAVRHRPARRDPSPSVIKLARAIRAALAPIEDRRQRGAALTLLFGKDRTSRRGRCPDSARQIESEAPR